MKWTNRKASLAICSVPESDRRGKRIHAATMLLNARLKQLCKSIKARFIDLSRELTSKGAMQKDGLQYGEEGIRVVTERLGAVASRFLGLRRDKVGSQYQSDPWRYGSYPQMGRTEMSQKKCVTYDIPGMTVGPPHIGVPHVKDLRLKTQVKGHQPPLSNQPEYILQPQSEQLSQVPTFPEIGVPLIPVHQSGGMTGPRVTMQERELSNVNTENGSTYISGVTPIPWLRPAPGRHDAAGGCANGESHSPPTTGGNAVLGAMDKKQTTTSELPLPPGRTRQKGSVIVGFFKFEWCKTSTEVE